MCLSPKTCTCCVLLREAAMRDVQVFKSSDFVCVGINRWHCVFHCWQKPVSNMVIPRSVLGWVLLA